MLFVSFCVPYRNVLVPCRVVRTCAMPVSCHVPPGPLAIFSFRVIYYILKQDNEIRILSSTGLTFWSSKSSSGINGKEWISSTSTKTTKYHNSSFFKISDGYLLAMRFIKLWQMKNALFSSFSKDDWSNIEFIIVAIVMKWNHGHNTQRKWHYNSGKKFKQPATILIIWALKVSRAWPRWQIQWPL